MAKFELKFFDCLDIYNSDNIMVKLSSVTDKFNFIIITTEIYNEHGEVSKNDIYLDKSTAIKFAKTLRTEINKITEREVNNG
jgi:hypothetical protein